MDTPGSQHDALRTGHAEVDAVLDDVAAAALRPVAEHPAIFGAAHTRLTEALTAGADPALGPTPRPPTP